jgi:hypothetical protein
MRSAVGISKLANFLQIGNSGLGPNQGCHYFLSVGAYRGPYPTNFHRVQQTIQSVTGRLRMNTPYQIEARKYWVEADLKG